MSYRRRTMQARFYNPAYWIFGIWAFEAMFWTVYMLVWLVVAIALYLRRRHFNAR